MVTAQEAMETQAGGRIDAGGVGQSASKSSQSFTHFFGRFCSSTPLHDGRSNFGGHNAQISQEIEVD